MIAYIVMRGQGGHELDRVLVDLPEGGNHERILNEAFQKMVADCVVGIGDTFEIEEG